MRRRAGLHYLEVVESTQTLVKRVLDTGAPVPVVAVTEAQTAGRGRLDRAWSAPPRSSVLVSVGVDAVGQGSAFTLMVGVVVAQALEEHDVHVALKWPNDIVVVRDERIRKLGGILTERHGDRLVVGIGLNIDLADDELPTDDAISCRQLGVRVERERLIDDIIDGIAGLPAGATIERYRSLSATLGGQVLVSRIAAAPLEGVAAGIASDGALIIVDADGVEHLVTVGDVQHLRPSAG